MREEEISSLGISPREMKTHIHTKTKMSIVVLSIIAKKPGNYPNVHQQEDG